MKNNKLLKELLNTVLNELNNKGMLQPELEEWFLNQDYFRLSKEQVKQIIDSEFQDEILHYAMISSKLGFMAGVDTTMAFMDKDSVYGIVDSDNWTIKEN